MLMQYRPSIQKLLVFCFPLKCAGIEIAGFDHLWAEEFNYFVAVKRQILTYEIFLHID